DFILAHESADEAALCAAILRGGFEYQGQKCSAASRIYLPESMGKRLLDRLCAEVDAIPMGDVCDFRNFMGAVIDRKAYSSITDYIRAADGKGAKVIAGGKYDDKDGYFIRPTLVRADDPHHKLICEEIFGPVVTIHLYRDFGEALDLVDRGSPYAL